MQLDFEFEADNNKEFEVDGIWDSFNLRYGVSKSTTRALLSGLVEKLP